MMNTANGTILNFYRRGSTHAGDRGVIMLRTSTDSGATWNLFNGTNYCSGSDPAGCIFADASTNQFDSRNTSGGISYDGSTLIVFWMQYNQTGGTVGGVLAGNSAGAFYSRSTDNGVSWSAPAALAGEYWTYGQLVVVPSGSPGVTGSCATGCVAVTINGGLVPDSARQFLIFSYDNGSTWDTANQKTITGIGTQEIAILRTTGNQLIAFDRPTSANSPLVFLYSNDMGSTWTATTTNIALEATPQGWTVAANGQSQVSPWLTNCSLSDGSVTLFFAERDNWNDPSTQHVYNYLRAITFRPQGAIASPKGFATPQDLYAQLPPITGFVNFGYPTVVKTPGNTLLIEFNQQVSASNVNLVNLYTMTATMSWQQ